MRLSTILRIIRQTLSFKFEQQTILCVQKGFPRSKEGSVRRGSSFLEPPDCRPYQRFEKPNFCVKCGFEEVNQFAELACACRDSCVDFLVAGGTDVIFEKGAEVLESFCIY